MTVVVEVEMILSCRPLSYVSCKDPEEPHRTPKVAKRVESSNININDIPDHDIHVQPQKLSKRMQHLSNVLNHYWKR